MSGCKSANTRWRARQDRPLYFASGGNANSIRGDGRLTWAKPAGSSSPDRFRYDPDDPVPSVGGNNCCGTPTSSGPQDQRQIEGRRDVLLYTSDILQQEIEVTGPVKVVLFAASDGPDTDFVAKLIDVHPDGASYNMAEGIVRARYRESVSKPRPLTPGEVTRFEIDLVGTSVAFQKGHQIRVHVTSSHFPAVRPESQHGCRVWHDERGAGRAADHLSRRESSVAYSFAGDPIAGPLRWRSARLWRSRSSCRSRHIISASVWDARHNPPET